MEFGQSLTIARYPCTTRTVHLVSRLGRASLTGNLLGQPSALCLSPLIDLLGKPRFVTSVEVGRILFIRLVTVTNKFDLAWIGCLKWSLPSRQTWATETAVKLTTNDLARRPVSNKNGRVTLKVAMEYCSHRTRPRPERVDYLQNKVVVKLEKYYQFGNS
jgi:hypothetical protein